MIINKNILAEIQINSSKLYCYLKENLKWKSIKKIQCGYSIKTDKFTVYWCMKCDKYIG